MNFTFDYSEINQIIRGEYDPSLKSEFVQIDSIYCYRKMYMLEPAYRAFVKMAEAAATDSIDLKIISATRDFNYQKMLWENKWTGKTKVENKKLPTWIKDGVKRAYKILEYTAPPGFTRHHWGTDIDINSVEPEYFDTDEGKLVYQWLCNNAPNFGFCQTYKSFDANRQQGFQEEKWHWSFVEIADLIWQEQLNRFSNREVRNFKGSSFVKKIDLLNIYLGSIHRCGD